MNRVCRLFLVIFLWGGYGQLTQAEASPDKYHEGSQYQRINPASPVGEHKGKVEVVEMFLYACPHCYELEPKMQAWLKDKPYVEFQRIPAIIGPSWADQARVFYMIESLPNPERLHAALFKAIHDDGLQIYNEYSVVEFLVSQGVDRQRAADLYLSPEVAAGADRARRLTVNYGLRGVPAVIVNGKFKTAPFFVHNQEEMFKVLDELVRKEKAQIVPAP